MAKHYVPEGWWDYLTFEENRKKFPEEELLKYTGQNIAWSVDGTRILASGKDLNEVADKLIAMGVGSNEAVLDWIPDPEIGQL